MNKILKNYKKNGFAIVNIGQHNKLNTATNKFLSLRFSSLIKSWSFLIHSSGNNISNKIRFLVQLRFTDLSKKEYMLRGYPVKR